MLSGSAFPSDQKARSRREGLTLPTWFHSCPAGDRSHFFNNVDLAKEEPEQ